MDLSKELFAFLMCILLHAQASLGQDSKEKLNACVSGLEASGKFSGCVLVADGGKVIFQNAYGLANREKKEKNYVSTRFRIGSLTKQFTAALIMQLAEDGLIN